MTFLDAAWLPDGRRVLVRAREETRPPRLYVLDVGDGTLNAIMPEGIAVGPVWALSPDGAMVAVASDHGVELHPLSGGPPRTVRGLEAQDRLLAWIEDGLLVSDTPNPLALRNVFKVDPVTGARRIWREILPRNPAGIMIVRTSS